MTSSTPLCVGHRRSEAQRRLRQRVVCMQNNPIESCRLPKHDGRCETDERSFHVSVSPFLRKLPPVSICYHVYRVNVPALQESIHQGRTVLLYAMFFTQFSKLSNDAGAPIHDSSEDVEYQGFDRLHRAARK